MVVLNGTMVQRPDLALRVRRNNHNRPPLDHLRRLETGVEIAHPQRPYVGLVLQSHRAMLFHPKAPGRAVSGRRIAPPGVPVPTRRERAPKARRHFTQLDQVTQFVAASEADADLGFMARMLAVCSLPRTNPRKIQLQYVWRNGAAHARHDRRG